MSNYFKVSNRYKKSFIENQLMVKDLPDGTKQSFIQEDTWRWGEIVVKTDLSLEEFKEDIDAENDNGFISTEDYEVADYGDFDDGCALWFNSCVNITEEEVEKMYEEDTDWEGVHGFGYEDSWIDIHGPFNIEDVTKDYT